MPAVKLLRTDDRFGKGMHMERARSARREDRAYGLSFAEALHECLETGVITIDPDGQITSFNKQAEAITHLTAEEVLNAPCGRLPASLRRIIEQTMESGRMVENATVSLEEREVQVSTFVSKAKGKGTVLAVLRNPGLVEKLETHMRQLDRLASVGALSASMAHEIKNALVAIRTFVELLLKENKDNELAAIVSRELRRIDSIVSQMLRLAGPAKPARESIHLNAVLDHALHLVQHPLTTKELTVRREYAEGSDVLHGDEYQLHQAFLNLFFNAVEAMSPGGVLTVRTERVTKPRAFRVTVADTGVGIAAKDLGRLFDAFFTTKEHGTGLGLPITRRIVEEHKGTITVESEPKKGTAFHVTLPI